MGHPRGRHIKFCNKPLKEKLKQCTQLVLTGKTKKLTKEPTEGVCTVLTVIRDGELTSRRSEMQPVRQSRKLRRIDREANEACASVFQGTRTGGSTWARMTTCFCKIFKYGVSMAVGWDHCLFPAHLGGHHITSSVEGGEDAMGIFNYREVELGIHLIWV